MIVHKERVMLQISSSFLTKKRLETTLDIILLKYDKCHLPGFQAPKILFFDKDTWFFSLMVPHIYLANQLHHIWSKYTQFM